ncbi:AAA family ATPase [Pseudomonas viridiflava]|uniref:AAA family ATPase n=1 Tax=Pseudomonas viridiflava TaxID=33069 RepID=UPI000F03E40B|nr:AAA family ATPase [Pseudomonas viridiflava]
MHIGIFGLSGSGKTTLTSRLGRLHKRFVMISASSLIKNRGGVVQYDELGRQRVFSNQSVLVDAYKEFKLVHHDTMIELHSIIESEEGVIEIEPQVLRGLGLDLAFFLKLDPCSLSERRELDLTKKRKLSNALELKSLQERAIEICQVALGEKFKIVDGEQAFRDIEEALSHNFIG